MRPGTKFRANDGKAKQGSLAVTSVKLGPGKTKDKRTVFIETCNANTDLLPGVIVPNIGELKVVLGELNCCPGETSCHYIYQALEDVQMPYQPCAITVFLHRSSRKRGQIIIRKTASQQYLNR